MVAVCVGGGDNRWNIKIAKRYSKQSSINIWDQRLFVISHLILIGLSAFLSSNLQVKEKKYFSLQMVDLHSKSPYFETK